MKNLAKFIVVIMSLLFVIQSCLSTYKIKSDSMDFDESKPYGLIVGTVTFLNERARFNNYFLEVVSMNTNADIMERNSTRLGIFPKQITKMKHNGELDEGKTYLLVFKRPVDSYEIYNIIIAANTAFATYSSSMNGFSIPFESKKGKITYIGNLVINEYADNNSYEFAYINNLERDLIELQNLYPNLKVDLNNVEMGNKLIKE